MAAGAWKKFGNAGLQQHNGTIDFDTDAFRMVLVTASWTPDLTATVWSSISTNEVANGNGYATHGKALTPALSLSGQIVIEDFDDQSWTAATFSTKYAVIVRDADGNGALAAGDIPLLYCDLEAGGGSLSPSNGTLAVTFDANGAYRTTLGS